MKNPRRVLAVCLAAQLVVLPVVAAAQDQKTTVVKTNSQAEEPSYSMYIGFVQDKQNADGMFRLFRERGAAFSTYKDSRAGNYFSKARLAKTWMGKQAGWSISISRLNPADVECLYSLMTKFLASSDMQRYFGNNVWMWTSRTDGALLKEPTKTKDINVGQQKKSEASEKPKHTYPNTFGVQAGTFKKVEDAEARLAEARRKISESFDMYYGNGFYQIIEMNLPAVRAIELLDLTRSVFGRRDVDVVICGETMPHRESMVRSIATVTR